MPRRTRDVEKLRPIGIIHSPHKRLSEVPRDCTAIKGEVEIFKKYEKGLKDIEGFSHIVVLWLFHLSKGYSLTVKPLFHEGKRGVFSTRHPDRPNPIGFSVVELLERKDGILVVRGIDALDGTPVLDIKPYVSLDSKEIASGGWYRDAFD